MKKRRLLLFSISISILLMFSLLVYSQVKPVESRYITQDVFINILVKTLGLEDELSSDSQKVAATSSDKAALLASYNIEPIDGWQPTKILSKGDAAYVLCQILGIDLNPTGAETKIIAENKIQSNQTGKYLKVSVNEIPSNPSTVSNKKEFNQGAINILAKAISKLVELGMLKPEGGPDTPFTLDELRAIISVAAQAPGVFKTDKLYKAVEKLEKEGWTSGTLPWQEPISPTTK
jgi:hypothetical protein